MENPKVYEHKELVYQGKTIFGKMVMEPFNRIEKYFSNDESCFMFIETGDFILRTPDKTLHINSEEGLLAKCGNYFLENKNEIVSSEERLTFIATYFYPDVIQQLFSDGFVVTSYRPAFDADKIVIDKFLSGFKENISMLLDHPDIVDEALVLAKLKEFIILLAKTDRAPSVIEFVSSLFNPYEYNFKSIIEKNIYSTLSLEELAFLCGMSLATFKRKFSEYFSTSPKNYILDKKVEKAKQLLLVKENRIADVAYDCGFETVTTFNRNFKIRTGVSPTDFRNSHL